MPGGSMKPRPQIPENCRLGMFWFCFEFAPIVESAPTGLNECHCFSSQDAY